MCRCFSVSRSGYHNLKEHDPGSRARKNSKIIDDAARESHREYFAMCGLDKPPQDVRDKFPESVRFIVERSTLRIREKYQVRIN